MELRKPKRSPSRKPEVVRVVEGAVKSTVAREEFKDLKDLEYKDRLEINRYSFDYVVRRFSWYHSPFSKKKPLLSADGTVKGGGVVARTDDKAAARTLLDDLHESVVPLPPVAQGSPRVAGNLAKELRRSGIQFQASETGRTGIEFKEQGSMLTLPALVHDFKLATVAHNLRARELEDQIKPGRGSSEVRTGGRQRWRRDRTELGVATDSGLTENGTMLY